MKKQYKSSITKNHRITFFDGVPLKGYVTSSVIRRFCTRNKKKKALWEYEVPIDL